MWLLLTTIYCLFEIPRSPFDLKHPVGYLFGVATQYVIFLNTFVMTACAVSMGYGVYLLFISMCEDIENNLDTFSRLIKIEKNPALIFQQFSAFIQLHSSVKQLSCYSHTNTIIFSTKHRFACNVQLLFFFSLAVDFSNVLQSIALITVCNCIGTTCTSMLMINRELV